MAMVLYCILEEDHDLTKFIWRGDTVPSPPESHWMKLRRGLVKLRRRPVECGPLIWNSCAIFSASTPHGRGR
jgi:hypothetical protein